MYEMKYLCYTIYCTSKKKPHDLWVLNYRGPLFVYFIYKSRGRGFKYKLNIISHTCITFLIILYCIYVCMFMSQFGIFINALIRKIRACNEYICIYHKASLSLGDSTFPNKDPYKE